MGIRGGSRRSKGVFDLFYMAGGPGAVEVCDEEYSIKNPAASCKAGTFEGYDKRGKAGRSY